MYICDRPDKIFPTSELIYQDYFRQNVNKTQINCIYLILYLWIVFKSSSDAGTDR